MGDNEQNAANPVDDQEPGEAEDREERPAVAQPRPLQEDQGLTSAAAPTDDEIIIK